MLLNIVIIFLICVVFLTGILYLRLHALPEHIAHQTNKIQIQLVAVLGLIALFTHNQLFWIAALLLAMTDLPDFLSPVTSMARSLRTIARRGLHLTIPPSAPTATVGASDNVAPQAVSGALRALPLQQPRLTRDCLSIRTKGAEIMLEFLLCSMITIFPDYLFRRFGQGKRIGHEITIYSMWFELRWGSRRASSLRYP